MFTLTERLLCRALHRHESGRLSDSYRYRHCLTDGCGMTVFIPTPLRRLQLRALRAANSLLNRRT